MITPVNNVIVKSIMEDMVANQLNYYINGFRVAGWGTQYYDGSKFQPGLSNYDLYDGILGNILCSFFYSRYFDHEYEKLYKEYLVFFEFYLNDKGFSNIGNKECGAFGIIGGGIFALATILRFSDDFKVKSCLFKLLNQIPRITEKKCSLDFIYGITGLLRRLLHVRQVTQIDVTNEIICCVKILSVENLNGMELKGYAHGVYGVYDTLLKAGFPEQKIMGKLEFVSWERAGENKKVNTRWLHSWCNGSLGEIALMLTLYKHGHVFIADAINTKYEHLKDSILLRGDKYPIGLCHGMYGFTDISYGMKSHGFITDIQHKENVNHITQRFLQNRFTDYQLSSNGIMLGRLGVAYQLMRINAPEEIPSVLI